VTLRERIIGVTNKPGGVCGVRRWLDTLTPTERIEWADVLADPSLQAQATWRVMREAGFPGSDQPVTRHKRGACACGHS